MPAKRQLATFAAGCFWHVEEAFRTRKGVLSTTVGYIGGTTKEPDYQQICTDRTGHAEAVQLEFDPRIISYEKLLQLFWKIHDPTTLNQQGLDIGSQYRSTIFYHSSQQQEVALKSKEKMQKKFGNHIVTEIVPASTFYPAEEYHQKYLMKRGRNTC